MMMRRKGDRGGGWKGVLYHLIKIMNLSLHEAAVAGYPGSERRATERERESAGVGVDK